MTFKEMTSDMSAHPMTVKKSDSTQLALPKPDEPTSELTKPRVRFIGPEGLTLYNKDYVTSEGYPVRLTGKTYETEQSDYFFIGTITLPDKCMARHRWDSKGKCVTENSNRFALYEIKGVKRG